MKNKTAAQKLRTKLECPLNVLELETKIQGLKVLEFIKNSLKDLEKFVLL